MGGLEEVCKGGGVLEVAGRMARRVGGDQGCRGGDVNGNIDDVDWRVWQGGKVEGGRGDGCVGEEVRLPGG
eukprot:scaffold3675_cov112-Amphora_coffeaeformis.AAC.2